MGATNEELQIAYELVRQQGGNTVWHQLFKEHILDRGFDYYNHGLVEGFISSIEFMEATVNGNDEYKVHIDKKGESIIDMSCTCPYAEDGNYCKHMAAVLYFSEAIHVENEERTFSKIKNKIASNTESSIEQLVKEADETLIRNFLIKILKSDERLLSQFKRMLCYDISLEDMKRYKSQINKMFMKYTDHYDFIDYYNARSFTSELEQFLYHDIQGMLDNEQYKEAFELTNYIFLKTGEQDMDDSDGGKGMLAEQCKEIWQEILTCSDVELGRKMFKWYTEHLDGSVIDYMEDHIESILFENFMEEEFLNEKLRLTEEMACRYKQTKDSWSHAYHGGKWAVRHISIMQKLKMTWESIDEYCKTQWEFSAVRKFYVDNCINKKEYDTAVHVLNESRNMDKESPGLVVGYSLQLKEIYKQTENRQAYEKELWSLVLQYKAGDVDIYKELKSLYSDKEWEEKRELIFSSLPAYAHVDKLYKEEKLYDRLFEMVMNSNGLYMVTEYEKYLKGIYSEELLNKYESEVNRMVGYASDRKKYKEAVAVLKRMLKYTDGNERVEKIVKEWKIAYRNRPAMMDELGKL